MQSLVIPPLFAGAGDSLFSSGTNAFTGPARPSGPTPSRGLEYNGYAAMDLAHEIGRSVPGLHAGEMVRTCAALRTHTHVFLAHMRSIANAYPRFSRGRSGPPLVCSQAVIFPR